MWVTQSYPTLCNTMNCSPPGSSVHENFQIRLLEWVAIPFSRGSSWLGGWTWVSHIAGGFFTIWATREAPFDKNNCWTALAPRPGRQHRVILFVRGARGHQEFLLSLDLYLEGLGTLGNYLGKPHILAALRALLGLHTFPPGSDPGTKPQVLRSVFKMSGNYTDACGG